MRAPVSASLTAAALLLGGCPAEDTLGSTTGALSPFADGGTPGRSAMAPYGDGADEDDLDEDASNGGDASDATPTELWEGEEALECPYGGKEGDIQVAFDCGMIQVQSCKDISNVVVECEDGTQFKFDSQSGHIADYAHESGCVIVRTWVKAGANHSGDGPGYGEEFLSPEQDCDDTEPPMDDVPPGEDDEPPSDVEEPPTEQDEPPVGEFSMDS